MCLTPAKVRSRTIIVAVITVATVLGNPLGAEAENKRGISTGGTISDGTPTAVVRQSASSGGGGTSAGGIKPRLRCGYRQMRLGVREPGTKSIKAPGFTIAPKQNAIYFLDCTDSSGAIAQSSVVIYNPGNPQASVVTSQQVAQMASEQLNLDLPDIGLSPPVGSDQIVGIPTWFWVNNLWSSSSASASLSGVTATVTATPVNVVFDTGDGTTLTCLSPVIYDKTRSVDQQQTNCSHTYIRPGNYTITATISWDVNWSASTGEGASLGSTTRTAEISVHVVEVQAVIN